MIDINELTIGQAKEVAVHHGLRIVVLDRGFIYVGIVTTDGEWVHIERALNVRRWGTTSGLGQLALEGPTPDTRLDRVGTVSAAFHTLQHLIEVQETKWAGYGYGDAYGDGDGDGSGDGAGYGDGYGDGYGYGSGDGYGDGYGDGAGYGSGDGDGYSDG